MARLPSEKLSKALPLVVELLKKDNLSGHTYSLLHPVAQTVSQRLRVSYDDVVDTLTHHMTGSVVVEGKRISLTELYEAEMMIASRVDALLKRSR